MLVALVGNQNSGKTTLFNALTGSNQHVGNFPGVTIDAKIGFVKQYEKEIKIVDLPGTYSLSPYSKEEAITRDFIINNKPDVILNIVDATNIERNLYLTLQLMELDTPMIIALNMMDEVKKSGNSININFLETKLGVKICPISASKNEGLTELIRCILTKPKELIGARIANVYQTNKSLYKAIDEVTTVINNKNKNYPKLYVASRLIEGDKDLEEKLNISQSEKNSLDSIIKRLETITNYDHEMILANMRYTYINELCHNAVRRKHIYTKEQIISQKIDKLLTNKYLAFPIFIFIMSLVFYLTFGLIGYHLSNLFELGINSFIDMVRNFLTSNDINPTITSLVCDGALGGVGAVLSFIPTIITLFFFLSLLEDSGYMARIAFIMDKPLQKIGLSGRSFVPMLIGFGCSVPAVMSTRTLKNEHDKKLTIMLVPYMSCSAKLPVFTILTSAFFGQKSAFVMIILYIIGIITAIAIAYIYKVIYKSESESFMMELPTYRMPKAKTMILLMWEKAKDFIKKAFTIIFVASLIIWFLQSFDLSFTPVTDNNNSILASIARLLTPMFTPIGVTDWRVTSALITGLSAKESIVSTLELLGGGTSNSLITMVGGSLNAISLVIFILLYMPCVATYAAIKRELKSSKTAVFFMVTQTLVAYIFSTIIYQVGRLLSSNLLNFTIILLVIILFIIALIYCIKNGCLSKGQYCKNCNYSTCIFKRKNKKDKV